MNETIHCDQACICIGCEHDEDGQRLPVCGVKFCPVKECSYREPRIGEESEIEYDRESEEN